MNDIIDIIIIITTIVVAPVLCWVVYKIWWVLYD